MSKKKVKVIKNRDIGFVELKLNDKETFHTNPDGSKVEIKFIGEEYFKNKRTGKRKKKGATTEVNDTYKGYGSSSLFPNYKEYQGWLNMNNLVSVPEDELEDKWS